MKFRGAVVAMVTLTGCALHSESIEDLSAGLNGGFETVKYGLPVNWLLYTPKTVKSGDFDMIVDSADKVEGKYALKFVVRDCSAQGGWLSPGFAQEVAALPGSTYSVSFWAKGDAPFNARVGGVTADNAMYETMVRSAEQIGAWRRFDYEIKVPMQASRLRFELSITQPGTLAIDDIAITGR